MFVGVIPSFPAEYQQVIEWLTLVAIRQLAQKPSGSKRRWFPRWLRPPLVSLLFAQAPLRLDWLGRIQGNGPKLRDPILAGFGSTRSIDLLVVQPGF